MPTRAVSNPFYPFCFVRNLIQLLVLNPMYLHQKHMTRLLHRQIATLARHLRVMADMLTLIVDSQVAHPLTEDPRVALLDHRGGIWMTFYVSRYAVII
jgi:hypothetical protein